MTETELVKVIDWVCNHGNIDVLFITREELVKEYLEENEKLALTIPVVSGTFKEKHINRFEVIDKKGRSYTNWIDKPFKIETSLQDDGKTLKVFLNE